MYTEFVGSCLSCHIVKSTSTPPSRSVHSVRAVHAACPRHKQTGLSTMRLDQQSCALESRLASHSEAETEGVGGLSLGGEGLDTTPWLEPALPQKGLS